MTAVVVTLPEASKRMRTEGALAATTSVQTTGPDAELPFVAGESRAARWTNKQADACTRRRGGVALEFLKNSKASPDQQEASAGRKADLVYVAAEVDELLAT